MQNVLFYLYLLPVACLRLGPLSISLYTHILWVKGVVEQAQPRVILENRMRRECSLIQKIRKGNG